MQISSSAKILSIKLKFINLNKEFAPQDEFVGINFLIPDAIHRYGSSVGFTESTLSFQISDK